MSKAKARVFVPLTKVDEEQRLVYGTITQEILDKSGEVMDYETSKPNFQKWSDSIHEASGGLSKGNLRVMHGLTVAGKLTDIAYNDDDQSIEVCSKVVDDSQWEMVKEGCYTGFSVGGSYGKRWTDNGVKKFTAVPNEVSLVDNPCVPSATFSLVKADGAEEAIEFKVEHDADQWPDLAKSEDGMKGGETEEEAGVTSDDSDETKKKPKAKKAATNITVEPNAAQIAEKAGELAKAAANGTTWQDHIEAAREELMKGGATQAYLEQQRQEGSNGEEGTEETEAEEGEADEGAEGEADEGAEEEAASDDSAGAVKKTTPPGVKQVWTASDGKTFEKKAEAEAHEVALQKAAEPKSDAEKLRDRLSKATTPADPVEDSSLLEDFDRLSKVFDALSTPFDDNGQPKLEKGMYTVNRFSNVLSDMASLSKTIKNEYIREGGDSSDATVSTDIINAVKSLAKSFITYATDQVTELLSGMDDDVLVCYHDYYYAAAQDNSDNQLAKDVCSLLVDHKDDSRERRETLIKAFGYVEAELVDDGDTLSPPMQKRFDALEAENVELKKVAGEAVEKVEELAKRMQALEDKPEPRAPRNVIEKGGEGTFLGKSVTTQEEKIAVVQEMLATHGPDAMATMMIKAAHAGGGQQLRLRSE